MTVSAFALSSPSSSPLRVRSFKRDLQGQRVAVVGLGNSGRAAIDLALARGASVLAIDKNEQLMPLENDPQFSGKAYLQTILGHCDATLLANADRIVVSPGVPLEEFGLSTLLQSGRHVMSELDFAAEVLPENIKVLAITGTNGKSTVTSFAGQMLHNLGIEAFVGGNLGTPLSKAAKQCLEAPTQRKPYQVAVVEVSSYQMEIPNQHFSPSVAVVLNFTPDHLERHKTMENYALTKCSLFSHMKDSGLAVLPLWGTIS
ncbi:putative UDP-N-acetylmuramoyl-L-alanine--D-glutamate ligase [Dioscorea sansibarensis]